MLVRRGMKSKLKIGAMLVFTLVGSALLILESSRVSAAVPYITERVNLTNAGSQMASGNLQDPPQISQDGRYVAFSTSSTTIVSGDTNGDPDIFVRDRKLGTTVRANVSSTGAELSQGYGSGFNMSANGRFIIFASNNNNVVPGDTNGVRDLFIRDLKNNTTERVSLTYAGGQSAGATDGEADISADGRYVVFTTAASDFVSGDTNGVYDIFVRDRKLSTTTLLSKSNSGALANAQARWPSISCDGSYVTFVSGATNLVSGDTNGFSDVFLVDRIADEVANITLAGNGAVGSGYADVSCSGGKIVMRSDASNLIANDTNGVADIFTYKIFDDVYERVNVNSAGGQTSLSSPGTTMNAMDFSGRYITFSSDEALTMDDTNNTRDVFLKDSEDGSIQRVSKRSSTVEASGSSQLSHMSLDGREVVYASGDTGLVTGDTNSSEDIFVSKTGI